MSIARFLKRSKPDPDTPPLPELYANAWQAIIRYLDWPERLGVRLACKAFHAKQPGLRLPVINQMILSQFLPVSIIRLRRWDDYENLHSKPRSVCIAGCPFHGARSVEDDRIYDHHICVNPSWDESILLYENAVLTVRAFIGPLEGSFFSSFDDATALQAKANELVRILGGMTAVVRAARISGRLKMSRPMSWEGLFEMARKRSLVYEHLEH